MGLTHPSNRRCPKCGKHGHVWYLDDDSKFLAKCINCNHYIRKDELSLVDVRSNTHFDEIRTMPKVDLAWLLARKVAACYGCEASTMEDCKDCWMLWLDGLVEGREVKPNCRRCEYLEVNPHSDESYCMHPMADAEQIFWRYRQQRRPKWCPLTQEDEEKDD